MFGLKSSRRRKQEEEEKKRQQEKLWRQQFQGEEDYERPPPLRKNVFRFITLDGEMATLVICVNRDFEFFLTRRQVYHKFELSDVMDIDESSRDRHIVRLAIRPPEKFIRSLSDDNVKRLVGRDIAHCSHTLPPPPPPPPPPASEQIPLVLTINFHNWAGYAHFIRFLIESNVFYRDAEPPPTASQRKSNAETAAIRAWYASSSLTASLSSSSSSSSDNKSKAGRWFKNNIGNRIKKLPFSIGQQRNSVDENDEERWRLKLTPERAEHLANDLHMLAGWKIPALVSQQYTKISMTDFILNEN